MNNNKNTEVLARLISALNADWNVRGDYIGRVKQKEKVTVFAEDGTPIETEIEFSISFESVRSILKLVREKANLPDDFRIQTESQSE
jgi:L-rhamnose isomerase